MNVLPSQLFYVQASPKALLASKPVEISKHLTLKRSKTQAVFAFKYFLCGKPFHVKHVCQKLLDANALLTSTLNSIFKAFSSIQSKLKLF